MQSSADIWGMVRTDRDLLRADLGQDSHSEFCLRMKKATAEAVA